MGLQACKKLKKKIGNFDLIYSANTITHIKNLNNVFKSINLVLSENGVLILEGSIFARMFKEKYL